LARVAEQTSSQLVIRHEKLDLHIFLSSLDKLFLHEETTPDRVSELKREFLHDQMMRNPIVVDADTYVVLDGMHRVAALRELNCVWVPVCAVDYLNPNIRICAWYRTMSGGPGADEVESALLESGLSVEPFSFKMATFMEKPMLALLFANGEYFKLTGRASHLDTLRIAEGYLRQLGFSVNFETEHDALQILIRKKKEAVMTLPSLDKAAVREAGLTGRLLPHKVTRHVVPARPLGVNIPLSVLKDETAQLKELNRRFVEDLRAKKITRGVAGTIVGDRRYEEETFIFD
jgi:hypothetical protein